jgi:hypothetical protein
MLPRPQRCWPDISGAAVIGRQGSYALFTSELPWEPACRNLLANCGVHRDVVADEITVTVADAIQSGARAVIVSALRLVLSLPSTLTPIVPNDLSELRYWTTYAQDALEVGLISTRQALEMTGGPTLLFQGSAGTFGIWAPYFAETLLALEHGWPAFGAPAIAAELTAFGEYLIGHPEPPWLEYSQSAWDDIYSILDDRIFFTGRAAPLNQAAYLGAAAMLLILEEIRPGRAYLAKRRLGPLRHLAPYLTCRQGLGKRTELPDLMVPDQFRQTFRGWAEGRFDFTVQD